VYFSLVCDDASMNSVEYELPNINWDGEIVEKLLRTHEAVGRLDERAKRSPVRDGWRERLLLAEACACQLTEGDLVHLNDLVLLDGGSRVGAAGPSLFQALQKLRAWRNGLTEDAPTLLRGNRPGLLFPENDCAIPPPTLLSVEMPEVVIVDESRRDHWRRIMRATTSMPPLAAAAVVWDAWLTLQPETNAAWRAPLLAALVLKARGLTTEFLVPIDAGRRLAAYRHDVRQSVDDRFAGFLSWVDAGTAMAGKELDKVVLAGVLLRHKIKDRRKSSRLPALVNLFLSRPLVSVPIAAKALGCSHQAVEQMLPLLGSLIEEVTERQRFRAWTVPQARPR
jgi:hypothetical protein